MAVAEDGVTGTAGVFSPIPTASLPWWRRLLVATLGRRQIGTDPLSGTVVELRHYRGRWYVMAVWSGAVPFRTARRRHG